MRIIAHLPESSKPEDLKVLMRCVASAIVYCQGKNKPAFGEWVFMNYCLEDEPEERRICVNVQKTKTGYSARAGWEV